MNDTFLNYGGKRWLAVGMASSLLLVTSYLWYRRQMLPHGGTPIGLTYGVVGTAVILVLMALGIRKRRFASGLGSMQGWTSAHIYLGLLTLLLIPMHAGFKFRFDIHTLAFALLLVVVVSGIIGMMVYRSVPPRLTRLEEGLQADKIDSELTRLASEMRALAKNKSDQFVRICRMELERLTTSRHQGWRLLWMPRRTDPLSLRGHELAKAIPMIPPAEHQEFQALCRLIMQTVQLEHSLAEQMRLRNAMQAWLYIHVPVSLAMMVAITIHILAVFYY